jgi:hypothetical protein
MKISETKSFVQLLKENIDKELLDWGLSYIDNSSCDELYTDLIDYQKVINQPSPSPEIQLSDDDKKELAKNIQDFKKKVIDTNFLKEAKCDFAKGLMKDEFIENSKTNPKKLTSNLCWFAKKKGKTLKACVTSTGGTPTGTQPTGPTGGGQQGGTPSGQSGTSEKSGPQPTTQPVTKKFDYDKWEF